MYFAVRVCLPDRPGTLAALAGALSDASANIVTLDVVDRADGYAVDDLCIEEGWNLEFKIVRREGYPAAGGSSMTATCQLSETKKVDCPGLG